MKQKLTFLFALLCMSAMSWAIDWSGYEWIGNGSGNAAYTDKFKMTLAEGQAYVNIQSPGFATAPGIYTTLPAGIISCSLPSSAYDVQGTGMILHVDYFTAQETEITVTHGTGTAVFTVYYADGEPDDLTGWNLARGKATVAGKDAGGEYAPSSANDINVNSRWASGSGAKHYAAVGNAAEDWWYVDLGDYYRVDQIKILFERANAWDYDLLISNNAVSWTILGTYTTQSIYGNNPATDYNVYDFSADPKVGRYVKIFVRQGYENLAYGVSMWEFEVYGDHGTLADTNPPSMTSAVVSGDPTHNQVNIAVAGTDTEDGAVVEFHVVDADKNVDQACTAVEGVIAVTGLSASTSYSFTITALDAAGNESENNIVVAATTPADMTLPQTAAPVPTGTNKEVLPIYSDAFASILEHSFDKDGFAGMPLYMEKNFSGDNCLIYDRSGAAQTFTTWGMYDDGANAIIAQSAYRAEGKMGVDASAMENLHIDIWSLQACNTIIVRINDGGRTGDLRLSHDGSGWKSYDIPLSEFVSGANTDNVRWFKFEAFDAITGKVALDNVYFWKTVSGLSSVSATPNHSEMGTATVKQNNVDVTEVTTGTEVTFSAVANEGYIFVDWSNGETAATFNATVNSSMNLTANFRQLGTTYCNTELANGDNKVYVTYKKTANENEYTLIVRSTKAMTNFSNAYVGHVNGTDQINLNGQGTLSGNGHMLSYTFTSTTEPGMNTPLYIMMPNEVTFSQLTNVEFAIPCADPEITAIELNKTEATLDMGNTLTLVPSFTPAYMSADITWQTSDNTKATVTNGVVTPVAPGEVTITAKVTESVKATCVVTVQAAASHNWYGYGTDKDLDYTYRIEYTTDHHIVAHVKRQGSKTGLVDIGMNINNVWTAIEVTEGEEEGWKKGTTAATYTAGDEITIIFQSNFSGASSIIEFDYTVGADNSMPTIVPTTLALSKTSITMGLTDDDIQLTTEMHHRDASNQTIIWTSDEETVATVVNGLIHPVGVGSATITAKCQADENVSATCTVTVVGALEPATFWGNGEDNGVAIAYSITRNTNHTLTYAVEVQHNKADFQLNINDGEWHAATLSEGIYTWTSTDPYADGDHFSGFIHMPYAGGVARVDFVNYEVGSESARRYIPITVVENADNSAVLTANDEKVREVTVTRSFIAGNLYTLVLPFNADAVMTAEKLPGQLTKLNNSYFKENGDLRINFVDADAIEAGVPYLYAPSDNVVNPVFAGVTVNEELNPSVSDERAKYYGIYAPTGGVALKAISNAYVLGSDQYLYAVQDLPDTQTMNALRGYFVLNFPGGSSGAPKHAAMVVFNSEETGSTTGTEDVQDDAQYTKMVKNGILYIIRDGKTYNAQGQLVK